MRITGQPVPITPGVQVTLTPPQPVQQLESIIVQNVSPYLVTVTIGGDQYSLPAYTADLYPTPRGGQNVTAIASNPDNTTGVSANLIAIWNQDGSSSDSSDTYPATLTPPPVAVGIAVAQQVLLSGVPNVLLETVIPGSPFSLQAPPSTPTSTGPLDVHSYASVIIVATSFYRFKFTDANGDIVYGPDSINGLNYTDANGVHHFVIPPPVVTMKVRAKFLTLFLQTGDPIGNFTIIGTNRQLTKDIDSTQNASGGEFWAISPAVALTAGTNYSLTLPPNSAKLSGPHRTTWFSSVAIAGSLILALPTGAQQVFAVNGTSGDLGIVNYPDGAYLWQFTPSANVTPAIQITAV